MNPFSRANGVGRARTQVFLSYDGSAWVVLFFPRTLKFRTMTREQFARRYRKGWS